MSLRELLEQQFGTNEYEIIDGIVSKVYETDYLVDVERDDGITSYDIKLRAVSDGDKAGLVCLPANGSHVIIAKVRSQPDYVLLKSSRLDKVIVEIGGAKMIVSNQGFEIRMGEISLKDVLNDLKTLLLQFKVTTPSGPSTGLLPDTANAITQFANKFNQLLNA